MDGDLTILYNNQNILILKLSIAQKCFVRRSFKFNDLYRITPGKNKYENIKKSKLLNLFKYNNILLTNSIL